MPSAAITFCLSSPVQSQRLQAALPRTSLHLYQDHLVDKVSPGGRKQEDRRVAKRQDWIQWEELGSCRVGQGLERAGWSMWRKPIFPSCRGAAVYRGKWEGTHVRHVCPFWNYFLVIQYTELSPILINELWLIKQVCSGCSHTKKWPKKNHLIKDYLRSP